MMDEETLKREKEERRKELLSHLETYDKLEVRDPQSSSEYAPRITDYLFSTQGNYVASRNYCQDEKFSASARGKQIEWLVEAHYRFRMFDETLYVAINAFDRFIDLKGTTEAEAPLIAISSLLIATKYEDIYPPELSEMMKLLDKKDQHIKKPDILRMEGDILEALGFDFTLVSSLRFLQRFAKIVNLDERSQCIAQLLMEIALCDSN
jgi:hypothetical protein